MHIHTLDYHRNMNNLKDIYKLSAYKIDYAISPEDKLKFKEAKYTTYGEVTYESTKAIVERFKDHFNSNAVFYDLGCGLGKMVIHIATGYNVESYGIELAESRLKGANQLKESYCKDSKLVNFLQQDFTTTDLSRATVIYFDNTVYESETIEKIWESLNSGTLLIYRKPVSLKSQLSKESFNISGESFKTTYNSCHLYYAIKK